MNPFLYPVRSFTLSYWACWGIRSAKDDRVQRVQEECQPRPVGPRGPWGWRQGAISKCYEPITHWYNVTSQKKRVFNHNAVITLRLANRTIPFIHSFHWYLQNATIPCCFQELLLFVSVMYFFLAPFSTNYSSIPHLAIYFVAYLLILFFPNSYIILFWEFCFLPFSVHAQTKVMCLN